MSVSDELAAGDFSAWLAEMRGALRGEHDADVPCNGCTACCTSSQFIPIAAHETDTIAHIPKELLFPAPRMPGHYVLGYDARGHCPMLVDDVCTIYEHRPRTCRTYDCRVLAAAEVTLDDDDQGGDRRAGRAVAVLAPDCRGRARAPRRARTRPCSWASTLDRRHRASGVRSRAVRGIHGGVDAGRTRRGAPADQLGFQGLSHGVSGQPSAAAMSGNAVAPSTDSRTMSA